MNRESISKTKEEPSILYGGETMLNEPNRSVLNTPGTGNPGIGMSSNTNMMNTPQVNSRGEQYVDVPQEPELKSGNNAMDIAADKLKNDNSFSEKMKSAGERVNSPDNFFNKMKNDAEVMQYQNNVAPSSAPNPPENDFFARMKTDADNIEIQKNKIEEPPKSEPQAKQEQTKQESKVSGVLSSMGDMTGIRKNDVLNSLAGYRQGSVQQKVALGGSGQEGLKALLKGSGGTSNGVRNALGGNQTTGAVSSVGAMAVNEGSGISIDNLPGLPERVYYKKNKQGEYVLDADGNRIKMKHAGRTKAKVVIHEKKLLAIGGSKAGFKRLMTLEAMTKGKAPVSYSQIGASPGQAPMGGSQSGGSLGFQSSVSDFTGGAGQTAGAASILQFTGGRGGDVRSALGGGQSGGADRLLQFTGGQSQQRSGPESIMQFTGGSQGNRGVDSIHQFTGAGQGNRGVDSIHQFTGAGQVQSKGFDMRLLGRGKKTGGFDMSKLGGKFAAPKGVPKKKMDVMRFL